MKVLVVGGGGREHALCWALSKSPSVDRLFAAPGNPGMAGLATLVPVAATDARGLVEFARRESIDLTVVGPEAPLVGGLVDDLQARGLPAFGPTRAAARIEGSKAWARRLCHAHGIPAPASREFHDVGAAMEYVEETAPPYVIKADGLAAGKGVTIAPDRAAARRALEDSLVRGVFGDAGTRVLVEEHLEGAEVSALAIVDATDVVPLALAQDYKRALNGDRGPNTGGMGSFSPVPFVEAPLEKLIVEEILRGAALALDNEGILYRGLLYAGLMLTADGPKVLEFNCRFGDPETQVILPRLTSDLAEALLACAEGRLSGHELSWTPNACVGVVLAGGGYPGAVETGHPISGLGEAAALEGVQVFHAGTALQDGRVVTAGGRVIAVSALGADLALARALAYEAASLIRFEGVTCRSDVAASPGGGLGERGA